MCCEIFATHSSLTNYRNITIKQNLLTHNSQVQSAQQNKITKTRMQSTTSSSTKQATHRWVYSPDWERPRRLPIDATTPSLPRNTNHDSGCTTFHNQNVNSNSNSNHHKNRTTTHDETGNMPTPQSSIKSLRIDLTKEANESSTRPRSDIFDDQTEASITQNPIAIITPSRTVAPHYIQTPRDITWSQSFNVDDTDMTPEEILLATKKRDTKELLGEMKRKMAWLTESLEGTAAWLKEKSNDISEGAEVYKQKKKKARRCIREVLALMEDRLEEPRCARKRNKKN